GSVDHATAPSPDGTVKGSPTGRGPPPPPESAPFRMALEDIAVALLDREDLPTATTAAKRRFSALPSQPTPKLSLLRRRRRVGGRRVEDRGRNDLLLSAHGHKLHHCHSEPGLAGTDDVGVARAGANGPARA